jgi:hypothetical protein
MSAGSIVSIKFVVIRASSRGSQKSLLNQVFLEKHKNVSPTFSIKRSQFFIALKNPLFVAINEGFLDSPETICHFKESVRGWIKIYPN